jgi:hypothetical protein
MVISPSYYNEILLISLLILTGNNINIILIFIFILANRAKKTLVFVLTIKKQVKKILNLFFNSNKLPTAYQKIDC